MLHGEMFNKIYLSKRKSNIYYAFGMWLMVREKTLLPDETKQIENLINKPAKDRAFTHNNNNNKIVKVSAKR